MLERFRNLERPQQILIGGGAVAVVVAVVLALVFTVFGGGDSTPTTTSGPTTTTTAPPPAPLTGVPTEDRDVLARPAISVKIGNNPEARPQAGLNDADIVYEEEVEGRITRFLALFHSESPSLIGPIRSVRLMDGLIARPVGGIFVYSGGANVPERIDRLNEAGLTHLDETALAGIDGARIIDDTHGNGVRPNILFTDAEVLYQAFPDLSAPQSLFSYLPDGGRFQGDPAPAVFVPVGPTGFSPTWQWNEDDGVWERFLGQEPSLDKSGDQVVAENLVVQFVERVGEESLVLGEGEAYVLADGKIVKGTWSRDDPDQPAVFSDQVGNEIALTPGSTWVHLPLAGAGEVSVLEDFEPNPVADSEE